MKAERAGLIFDAAPQRVYWELTRACDLACRHCRAEAVASRDPQELSPAEGRRLLEDLAGFGGGGPRVVLTGGDPLKRPDFWDLLDYGTALGLEMSVAPSGTATLTPDVIRRFQRAGARAMSLSLDGSAAERHDGFRGVPGSFDRTLEAARVAIAAGFALQVNTLVSGETLADLPAIAAVVTGLGAARWSLFFLIQVGRGRVLEQLDPEECEAVLRWLWDRSRTTSVVMATTEAPHYRRVALHRAREANRQQATQHRPGPRGRAGRHGFGIRDGNGIMFVSHRGDVQPSGFLPLVAGSVRTESPVDLYRESALFRALRDAGRFGGRCGRCEFREICGGSRARAYAASGDPLAEDPLCPYEPAGRPHAEHAEEVA